MKRIIQVAVLVGLALASVGVGAALVSEAPDALERALLDEDWSAVRREAPSLRQQHQLDAVADWLSGYASLASADYCSATAFFTRLDQPAEARQILGWITTLTEQHRGSATVTMLQGDALARNQRYEDALVALGNARQLDAQSALVRDVDGVVAALAGDQARAEADFRQAVAIDRTAADGYCNLGLLRMRVDDWSGAVQWLTRATELAPDFALAYNARGVAYFHMGDLKHGRDDLERSARACPGLDMPASVHNLQIADWYDARRTFRRQLGPDQTTLAGVLQQIIVIDIPGIETQGEDRPNQWGPVLIGTQDFARHNIRHQGVLGTTLQRPEPGTTTVLPSRWNEARDVQLLAPALADIRAGRSTYVKIDQNIKLGGYLVGGKPAEGEWARSVGNLIAAEARRINPNATVILNPHSKATLDAHGMDLSLFNQVILASDRGSVNELQRLADRYRTTQFSVITGDRDLPHGLQGFLKLNAPNVTVINLKTGGLLPTTVHGQVTDPTYRGVFEVKSPSGVRRVEGTLGSILQQARPLPSSTAGGLVRDPGSSYRLNAQQSAAIGADGLKGVGMPVTDMVVGRPGDKADVGALFGGMDATPSGDAAQTGFMCPFLIFAAMPEGGQ